MAMSEFFCFISTERSPKLLRTYSVVAWLHPSFSLSSSLREPPCGVSFFSPVLRGSSRKAAAWPTLPLRVPEERFRTSFWAQPEVEQQHSSCCLRQGRCYTPGLELTTPLVQLVLHFIFHCRLLSQCFSVLIHFHYSLILLCLIHFANYLIIIILYTEGMVKVR